MSAVDLQQVTKSFDGHRAVDELTLSVPTGCIYGFIGPNGSGKTTTLRMIMSILYPDSGSIRVFGQERAQAYEPRLGYLPEERGLYRQMKVRDVLRFHARLKGGAQVNREVSRWLERLGLSAWADKKVQQLSKGMSQKVQFVAAVAHRPDLVILDEPFTGLDPVNMDELQAAVLELRANGATVIFSTHDMGTAENLCDFIFMIFRGRKVLDGTLASIQDRYGSDTVRLRIEGDGSALRALPGVEHITDRGHLQELLLARGTDPQQLLAGLMARCRVLHFELARPSLHDIFVRIAGPAAETEADARA
jgi:ABC-2 type transport system ATP-binding protein